MDIVQAAYEGNVQLVKQYLTNENEINKRNEYGETALHSVLMGIVDNPEQSEVGLMIVRLLLSTNIDKNAKDNKGQTALFIAAITNQREITAELLKNKVDYNKRTPQNRIIETIKNNPMLAKLLIEDIEIHDSPRAVDIDEDQAPITAPYTELKDNDRFAIEASELGEFVYKKVLGD